MRFSTRTEYGLRAILRVASSGKKPYSLAKISRLEGISLSYLEKLFVKLKKGGFVESTRGMKGGYVLKRPASKIRVNEVIEVLEGSLAPFYCVDFKGKKYACQQKCLTQKVWRRLYQEIYQTLNSITLKDLIK